MGTKYDVAIVGGTGLNTLQASQPVGGVSTPFGEASAQPSKLTMAGKPQLFLARHGTPHTIPPDKINYRANLWLLKQLGVSTVIAVNAVGGIREELVAGSIVLPDQLIDYTYGREHTFSDGNSNALEHVDFTFPFSQELRKKLKNAAEQALVPVHDSAVYGVVQGPRLETVAEINRMERDGCDIVGMTAMPEAALARELGLDYASICLVVNPAAGRSDSLISMDDIHRVTEIGMAKVRELIKVAVSLL